MVAAACSVALLAIGGAAGESADRARAVRPNVVLITTDDQTAASLEHMRRTRSLIARRGASFENMIATFPLCCPARATWITGQYAHNHGVLDNQDRNGGGYQSLRDPVKVLPFWLDLAGYDTALVGKWLHDYHSLRRPPGWDTWHGLVPPTVTRYYGYEIADSKGGKMTLGSSDRAYLTDALTRRFAIPYIFGHARDPDPFFLHLSFTAPHWGLGRRDEAGRRCASRKPFSFETARAKPAPRHAHRFTRKPLPRPPSFDERNVADKPGSVRGRERLSSDVEAELTERYRCELAALLAVDEAVEQVDEALADTGLAESTYVIFTSDNGYMHGEHRIRAEKVQPYEEAIRVPFLISGPGIPARVEVDDPVANTDLAPTILELAAAPPLPLLGREMDGISLVPYLFGASRTDRAILIEAKRPPRSSARAGAVAPSFVGVRTRRYLYVEHYRATAPSVDAGFGLPIGAGAPAARELYDLETDPYQLRSRHGDARYAAPRAVLEAALGALRSCAGGSCVRDVVVPPPAG